MSKYITLNCCAEILSNIIKELKIRREVSGNTSFWWFWNFLATILAKIYPRTCGLIEKMSLVGKKCFKIVTSTKHFAKTLVNIKFLQYLACQALFFFMFNPIFNPNNKWPWFLQFYLKISNNLQLTSFIFYFLDRS